MKNRNLKSLVAAALASILVMGCNSSTYKPPVQDTQLSAYAGKANYPDKKSELATSVFASVAPDGTITIYNAGDVPFSNFELWVNRAFTLHVDKMDARNEMSFDPATLYNNNGTNLKTIQANQIATIQIYSQDKLWDVQGPIILH